MTLLPNYGSTPVWLVKSEHGDVYSAETSLNNAKAKATALGFLAVDITTTVGTVVNSKVTKWKPTY